ncbi:competence/damage-inducible protein A [Gemella sp. oral taxon 928]|uniref:competence/damage-inducible protein A n=1 Tax=Gemella sp. oral taxon 928 TaxID=1785995 RepID=UPI0007682983|nr:competence/damage-inducible protein A [Gemella sp. oral taxon 928]AME09808.1 competence/damage-inducible protein A [Gemella sp. oral taxon 928]
MRVELVSVGTEILLGDIVNTNTAYLSKELATLGIDVYRQTTVGDNRDRLLQTLSTAFCENDTVIITGGLGPTDDDITKECAAEYFNRDFYFHEYSWAKILERLTRSGRNLITDNNKKQAMIPNDAIVLENFCGTAPGIIIEEGNKRIILMPGPPREMKDMFKKSVRPYLERFSSKKFISKYIRFYGIGESLLETKIKHLMDNQTNPTLALYAKTGEVLLRVTASDDTVELCDKLINDKILEIEKIVGEYIYLIGDDNISETQTELHNVVANLLIENKLTISVAESLTGGQLSSMLVEKGGISVSLLEGIVCYSNKSKIHALGVREETLNQFGAVSEQTAKEMVIGVSRRLNSDVAVATTGIAGPKSDDTNKPVGLVYIAVYYKGEVKVFEKIFTGSRELIRTRSSIEALNEVRKIILEHI